MGIKKVGIVLNLGLMVIDYYINITKSKYNINLTKKLIADSQVIL